MDTKRMRDMASQLEEIGLKEVLALGPDELKLLDESCLKLLRQVARLQNIVVHVRHRGPARARATGP